MADAAAGIKYEILKCL